MRNVQVRPAFAAVSRPTRAIAATCIGLFAAAGLATAAAATASAETTPAPAPTATPTLVYTLGNKIPSHWAVSGNGRMLAVATGKPSRRTGDYTPIIEVHDLVAGTTKVIKVPAAQYLPVDPGFSGDGRYLSWTTATVRKGPKRSKIVDPTTWVRDLTTGGTRKVPHFDGNLFLGDGSFVVGFRGPVQRWKLQRDGSSTGELNRGAGVHSFTTGKFTAAPGRDTRTTVHGLMSTTADGAKFISQFGGRCTLVTTATGATTDLGACGDYAIANLSADGTTAFIDSRGWIDTATGQLVGPALDQAPFTGDARAWLNGPAGDRLNGFIVQCTPDIMSFDDDEQFTAPRRTFLLDRATRSFAPLAGPNTPLATTGYFMTGFTHVTAAGDELFWGDGKKIWRVATTPVGPAGPLPAGCMPIR
jgi:hypothetical protein